MYYLSIPILFTVWLVVCVSRFFVEFRNPSGNKLVSSSESTNLLALGTCFYYNYTFDFPEGLLEIPIAKPEPLLEKKQENALCYSSETREFNA